MLALFVLPIQAMAMFSGMNGMYIEMNNNDGDLTDNVMFVVNEKDVSIVLNPAEAVLMVGKTLQIEATVLPENVNHVKLVWDSRNKKVATVNESGLVTAVGPGESVITASLQIVVGGVISTVFADCRIRVERPVESIVLNPNNAVLEVGDNLPIGATVLPEDATNKTLQWTSNNTAVASVDDNGVVMALAPGDCMIIASCGDVEATCQIKVNNPVILADSIVVVGEKNEIEIGEVLNLEAIVYPENTSDTRLTWESSDNSIATVVEYGHNLGIVTGVAPGTCDIYAICGEVRTRGTYQITVKNPVVLAESVVLDPVEAELQIGSSITIAATVLPENVTNPLLKWYSSDETVAIVNKNGFVTAVGPGTCDITATCGNAVGTCHVTVTEPIIFAESVELFPSEAVLQVDEIIGIKATILPENMPYPRLDWRSSDESVATVSKKGFVTAVGPGSCDITATCDEAVGTCHVTVLEPIIYAESVELDPVEAELQVGGTIEIRATVSPDNVTNPELTWESSDEAVATVSQNGVVTAVGPGLCDITATCGNAVGTCHVTVTVPIVYAESVVLDPTSAELEVGTSIIIAATVLPENVTNPELVWQSSDESIATVSQEGVVKAVATGECEITASCDEVSANCHILVYDPSDVVISLDCDELKVVLKQVVEIVPIVTLPMRTDLIVASSDTTVVTAKMVNGKVKLSGVGFGKATITVSSLDGMAQSDSCEVVVSTLYGDVDHDGFVTISDVSRIVDYLLNNSISEDYYYFDVDPNGLISVGDLTVLIDMLLSGEESEFVIVPDSISLNIDTVSLNLGSTMVLEAVILPEDVTNKFTSWISTDEKVAKVSNGEIHAHGVGECDIIAACKDKLAMCHVEVNDILPEYVVLDHDNVSLLLGEQVTLTATVYPDNVTDKTIVWSSTNSSVATVVNGKVTAKAVGDCFIIADCQGKRDTCSVTVTTVSPEKVLLSQHSASMLPGEQITLTATVYPDNVTDKTVVWSSTNSSVATVVNGKVTAKAVGDCFIIADCQGKRDTCSVTVTAVSPEKVVMSQHSASLLPGEQITLTATVYPDNVTDKTVVWSSTNSSVATVVNGKVTAKAVGNCFIIADCQGKRDTCAVTVYVVTPESLVLNQSAVTLGVGEQTTLRATVYPENATNTTVTWRSTATSVATVNNGVVKAIGVGECDIIATCQNLQATCHVTVKNDDENTFTVNGVSFNMVTVEGGTFYMGAPATQLGSGTNERPQHYVTLSSFKIGQTEVTQELWVAVMGHNPSAFQGDLQRPVDNVSWEMCKEFLDSLNALTGKNFRFPTEAEWEFAARGGNLSEGYLFSGGNQPVGDVAWYKTNSESKTHPVAQKKPNELGLYDMSGNVAEWCSDWYIQYPSDPQTNPTGPATGTYKIYRGGDYSGIAAWCRPPYRAMQSTTYRREFLGLRLVL